MVFFIGFEQMLNRSIDLEFTFSIATLRHLLEVAKHSMTFGVLVTESTTPFFIYAC